MRKRRKGSKRSCTRRCRRVPSSKRSNCRRRCRINRRQRKNRSSKRKLRRRRTRGSRKICKCTRGKAGSACRRRCHSIIPTDCDRLCAAGRRGAACRRKCRRKSKGNPSCTRVCPRGKAGRNCRIRCKTLATRTPRNCQNVRCRARRCGRGQRLVNRPGHCCPVCVGAVDRRCEMVSCPRVRCSRGSYLRRARGQCCPTCTRSVRCLTVQCPKITCKRGYKYTVDVGSCCGRCVSALHRCTNKACPKITCRAGQRYHLPRGSCCGRCVGSAYAHCAQAKCQKIRCRRDQVYVVRAGQCCGICLTTPKSYCKNVACVYRAPCKLGQTYKIRTNECCGKCSGKVAKRCNKIKCPKISCSYGQRIVVPPGNCCGKCQTRAPTRCRYVRCPKVSCRAGQRFKRQAGRCCGTCVGSVREKCRSKKCPKIRCLADHVFVVSKGKCCGSCRRRADVMIPVQTNAPCEIENCPTLACSPKKQYIRAGHCCPSCKSNRRRRRKTRRVRRSAIWTRHRKYCTRRCRRVRNRGSKKRCITRCHSSRRYCTSRCRKVRSRKNKKLCMNACTKRRSTRRGSKAKKYCARQCRRVRQRGRNARCTSGCMKTLKRCARRCRGQRTRRSRGRCMKRCVMRRKRGGSKLRRCANSCRRRRTRRSRNRCVRACVTRGSSFLVKGRRLSCAKVPVYTTRIQSIRRSAAKCGDIDEQCVQKTYSSILILNRRLARLKRRCPKTRRRFNCRVSEFKQWLKGRQVARTILERRSERCGDEDVVCIKRVYRSIRSLDYSTRRRTDNFNLRCSTALRYVNQDARQKKGFEPVFSKPVPWWKEVTCVGLKSKFGQWLDRERKIRQFFHDESCKCHQEDSGCLTVLYKKIVHIQRTIFKMRNRYNRRFAACDRCAPIKLRFSRWLSTQRMRRHRLHLDACKCGTDARCMQEYVDRIKGIQADIKRRRKKIQSMHRNCSFDVKKTVTTAPKDRVRLNQRTGAAASVTFSLGLLMLISLIAASFL